MAVWDIVITAGQSQMSGNPGADGKNLAPRTNPATAKEYNTGPGLVEVWDNTSSSGSYKAQTGSPIPAFVNTWNSITGRNIAVCRAAVGGSALLASNQSLGGTNWSTSGTLFNNSITRFNATVSALTALGHTVGKVFVIWSQGYRDAAGGNDLETYGAANSALLTRWRSGTGVSDLNVYQELMYAPAAASPTIAANCMIVKDQQEQSYASTPGLKVGFSEGDQYAAKGWLAGDNLHYSQVGLNNMGVKFAQAVAEDLGLVITDPGDPVDPIIQIDTSIVARMLMSGKPLPSLPRTFGVGVTDFVIPFGEGISNISVEIEGCGGNGGNGSATLKGGAGGGAAYAKKNSVAVTEGETIRITVTAGGSQAFCQVEKLSTSTVVCRADYGRNGTNGNPNADGAAGLAANCIGDVTTSGQAGGVSGIDNGGNGAAPLGAAGGVYATGLGIPGGFPGGGGSAAGINQTGGVGGAGTVIIRKV